MRIVSRVGIGKNPTSHHLDVTGSANFDNQVFFQNNVFLNANVDLGNASTDLIAFNGRSTTSIEPNSTLSVNLGSSSLFWNNTYSKNLIIKNAGSIESDGNTLNLGTVSATTINIGTSASSIINIGKVGTTVNIYGSINKIQSTDTEIFDRLITLNKNGLAASASNSGFEIEENAVITAYIQTTSDRNEWLFKAPNKSGIISLAPGSSAFTHKIVSQASANRIWTFPDNTDTFVGTTNAQIVENKTLNNTAATGTFTANAGSSVITNGTLTTNGNVTINGSITINGTATGVGFVPLGAVIATIPALTGAYSCTATTAADSFGYVRCNGQVIADISSPLNGRTIPNINNDVFLQGNITSNVSGGSNVLKSHTHSIPGHYHVYGSHWSNDDSNDIYNDNGDGGGNTYTDATGAYGTRTTGGGGHDHQGQVLGGDNGGGISFRGVGGGDRGWFGSAYRQQNDGSHNHNVHSHRHWIKARRTHYINDIDGRYDIASGDRAAISGGDLDSRPKYITALYIMRIK